MKNLCAPKLYALTFGLFLGLCIWKFGNPVILDHKITAPETFSEWLKEPWPPHWANWLLLPLVLLGGNLIWRQRPDWPADRSLWLLPLIWLGWQLISAMQTVDGDLTRATLAQFGGCTACYFLGAWLFSREQLWRWLLPGLLAAFAFCLIRGIDQRIVEFPQGYQALVEGERAGWTNFPPAAIAQMKNDLIIISTNGQDVASPLILAKFNNARVYGTLVYPNALAGIVLLLWPVSLTLAFKATSNLRPLIRFSAIGMTIFLGGAAFFWSGSKLGWLIGMAIGGAFLLRLDWPRKMKWATFTAVLILGLGIFAVRFHHYFATGATSAGARLDYWRAAVQTTASHLAFGTGPGTFQRPYAQLKSPDSEMARLTHNDFLEQFSDSGLIGGLAYVSWIFLALVLAREKMWRSETDFTVFAIYTGILAWFIQGFGEFSLYIPALAWIAFTLLGVVISQKKNQFDKRR